MILLLGIYIGMLWTLVMVWKKISKRCWGCIAFTEDEKHISLRCKKHQGHDGKCYWTNISREKHREW